MHFNKMTNIAAGLALAASTAGAQAVGVASLTVVEIGGVTGMTMAAATASNSVAGAPFIGASGGLFYFGAEVGNGVMGGEAEYGVLLTPLTTPLPLQATRPQVKSLWA